MSRYAQNGRVTFDGTSADRLRLTVTRDLPDNFGVYYSLIRPNGTLLRDSFMSFDQIRRGCSTWSPASSRRD